MENLTDQTSIVLLSYVPQFNDLHSCALDGHHRSFWGHSGPAPREFVAIRTNGRGLYLHFSGFLIDGTLLDSEGSLNCFRDFYECRALRI